MIDDLVRLEAAKGVLDRSALIERDSRPALAARSTERIEKFTRLSTLGAAPIASRDSRAVRIDVCINIFASTATP